MNGINQHLDKENNVFTLRRKIYYLRVMILCGKDRLGYLRNFIVHESGYCVRVDFGLLFQCANTIKIQIVVVVVNTSRPFLHS